MSAPAAPGASSGTAKAAKRCPWRARCRPRLRLSVPGPASLPAAFPGPSFLRRSPGCARSESVGGFGNEPHQHSPNGDFVPSRSLFASKISLFTSKMRQCRDGAVCPARPLSRFCFGSWCGPAPGESCQPGGAQGRFDFRTLQPCSHPCLSLCCQAQGSALPCSCHPPAPGEEFKGGTNQILDFTALWVRSMWQQLLPVWHRGCLCQPGSPGLACAGEELGEAVCRARWHHSWDRAREAQGLWCC